MNLHTVPKFTKYIAVLSESPISILIARAFSKYSLASAYSPREQNTIANSSYSDPSLVLSSISILVAGAVSVYESSEESSEVKQHAQIMIMFFLVTGMATSFKVNCSLRSGRKTATLTK